MERDGGGGDRYGGFGLVELDTAGEAALCECADLSDDELIELRGSVGKGGRGGGSEPREERDAL